MTPIEVCDHRRVFVPAHQTITQFFHASRATVLVMTADQDIGAKIDGTNHRLSGGGCIKLDGGNGRTLDLRAIELRAGEQRAEVEEAELELVSAVDLLAELAR